MVVIIALTLLIFCLLWIDKKITWLIWMHEIYGVILILAAGVDAVLIGIKVAKVVGLL